jgi:D-galactarolactone cycloisomerase
MIGASPGAAMTIRSIDSVAISMPFDMGGPKPLFAGKPRQQEMFLVRVETDDGIVGWGEAFGFAVWPSTRTALQTLVAPLAVGRDEADIAGLRNELTRKLHLLGRTGPVMFALSGLDIALWDIAGKRAGKPLWQLLASGAHGVSGAGAGTTAARAAAAASAADAATSGNAAGSPTLLPTYASLIRYGDPALVAKNAARARADGFRSIKLHEITVDNVGAARAAIGPDVELMMDCNCPWTESEALAIARGVKPFDLTWFEEPVWPPEDYPALARVRRDGGIKVSAGENAMSPADFARMFEAGAVDIAQPSVTKIGGIAAFAEVVAIARRHGVRVVAHSPYFGPGLLATLHLTWALLDDAPIEYGYCRLDASPLATAIAVSNGMIALPQGPGLGCDPDPAVLREYAVA